MGTRQTEYHEVLPSSANDEPYRRSLHPLMDIEKNWYTHLDFDSSLASLHVSPVPSRKVKNTKSFPMDVVRNWQDSCDFEDSYASIIARPAPREMSLKLLVLGDVFVGKTALVHRYVNNSFLPKYQQTIGVDFSLKVIKWDPGLTIKLQLWDVAGTERIGSITRAYYRNANGCLLMFDMTNHVTFQHVAGWKEDLDTKCRMADGSNVPCLLVGNKKDRASECAVSRQEMESISRNYDFCSYRDISVKENAGVSEALRFIIEQMLSNSGRHLSADSARFQEGDSTLVTLGDRPSSSSRKGPGSQPWGCC